MSQIFSSCGLCEHEGKVISYCPYCEIESLKAEIAAKSTGIELAKELENYVNSNRNHAEFIDYIVNGTHRTLNQLIIGLFIKVMQAEAKTTRFDGRNEASVELCKRLNLDDVYLPYI